jgi:hypothetical protein
MSLVSSKLLRLLLIGAALIAVQAMCERVKAASSWSMAEIAPINWREIMRAKSAIQVKAYFDLVARIRSSESVCRAQLRASLVPSKCFKLIDMEAKARLIDSKERAQQYLWLESICRERAIGQTDRRRLLDADFNYLPPTCQEALKTREEDLKYVAQYSEPEALFMERKGFHPNSGKLDRNLNNRANGWPKRRHPQVLRGLQLANHP